ncbi:Glu/Leu/Phe/Val dehydrogenase dimerization domain-containing protein [Nocardioides sp.]|uniref:Leu/Phe/Val dehydrogenase n=1 Tax=Nocardioides sp. TaxID=35761 RepID=UPI002603B030|nr:Glu/Leu/Phe/Val dehydrogenase dimerization domain-containing protein [Nocardioides sp.]
MSTTLGLASPTATELPDPTQSEQLVFCSDPELGLQAVIAVDDTTLGPGLGGVRFRPYPTLWDGAREAQRLARAMTAKNALAGLPYGGAKSVILDLAPRDRDGLMRRFGEFVARLGGTYLPGVDMGTTATDLALMGAAGADATCSTEDPSPWTARGVFASIKASAVHGLGASDLTGVRVLVQGVGHVGHSLATQLAAAGALVSVSDVDLDRARVVADEVGGAVVAPDQVIGADVDIWAPCATAKVVTSEVVDRLRCRLIAGAANDTLSEESVADELQAAGILYVPDFVANAGGVIHIHGLRVGWDHDRIGQAVDAIGDRVESLLTEAEGAHTTALAAADLQRDRILAAGGVQLQAS